MKELLARYAEYNVWANRRMTEALLKLTDEQADKKIESSFPTIRATAHHVMAAEQIWLQRLLGERPEWVGDIFAGTISDACAFWMSASEGALRYVSGMDDAGLAASLSYTDRRGNEHVTAIFQVLHHVFNHSTYHRGQLVTMLRQCGVTEIPGMDFVGYVWVGSKNQKLS